MASSKTRIKPIRIANETADYFEGKALNRIVESVHRLLESGTLEFNGEELKIRAKEGVYTENNPVLEDIGMMAELFGIETGKMTEQFCEMLNDGLLTVSKGKLEIVMPEWAERFEETCHDRCMDVERTMEGVLKRL